MVAPVGYGSITATGISVAGTEGAAIDATVATFTDTNPNTTASDFTATINWGDGTTSTGLVYATDNGFAVSGNHAYADEGSYTVGVALTSIGGSSFSTTSPAAIGDAALAVTGASLTGTEGATIDATLATFTDANPNANVKDFTATITWGDGSTSLGTVLATDSGFAVEGAHSYADEGSYPITVAIKDIGGSIASTIDAATIGDAELSATGLSLTGTEGAAINATVATFTDGNPNATANDFIATIDWGDGTPSTIGTVISNGRGTFSVIGAHTYADVGQDAIKVTITDDGGSSVVASSTASVAAASLGQLHYYLEVNGIKGDVTAEGLAGAFAVDGFSFGATSPSSGTGRGVGRTTFSPLTVELSSLQGLAPLLRDELTNKAISTVELIGVATTGDKAQTVYDLKLTNALLTSFDNTPGSQTVDTSLTFDFQKASLTDHGVTSDGGLAPAETTNFTATRFTAPAALPTTAASVPDGSSLHYYLEVNGIKGDVTAEGLAGAFAVDGFSFGATSPSSGTGRGVGRTTFSPLTVELSSLQGLAPLLRDELTNKAISTVELIGVATTGDKAQTVYDLKLTDALLTSFDNTPGSQTVDTSLTFDFQKASLTDHGVTSDGGLAPAETTKFTATRFTAPAALPTTAASVPDGSSLHYYLEVNGIKGDVTAEGLAGAFAVDGFSFGATSPSSGTGRGVGRTTFSPLTVELSSLQGLAPLLRDELTNKAISTVELIGVATTGDKAQTVYDLKLTDALLTSFDNTPGSQTVDTSLTFDFQKASLTDHGVTSDGGLAPAETTNFTATRFTAPAALPTTAASVPDGSSLHYYLEVNGIKGDVTAEGLAGAFAVDGFSFGATSPSSGTGRGVGRTTFSPLTVELSSLQGLAPLLRDELTNKAISTVELIGVATTGDKAQTVYDLKLTDALLTSFDNTPGSQTVDTSLTFDFQKASLTDHGVTSDGGLAPAETTNFTATRFTAPAALPTTAASVPDGSSLHYYLEVNGIKGDVTAEGLAGAFAVDGFSFGATSPSSGTGRGVGRTTFSPLTVELSSLQGLAPLLRDELTNKAISTVELVGVATTGDKAQTVYDLKLTDALLTSFDNTPGSQTVDTSLTFDFQKASLTDHGVTSDGGLAPAETTNFTATRFTAPAALPTTAASVPDGSSLHYYLEVNGIKGDVTAEGLAGAFAVDGFSFGATSPSSGTGRGVREDDVLAADGRALFVAGPGAAAS